jgi:predicted dithiol-disulfide oxidoreductase (DUF899 family)
MVVHHFMFAPEWEAGCRSCSAFLDQIGHLTHLKARGTSFAAVSRAPYTRILPFKARMGWTVPWSSSYLCDFNRDFEVTLEGDGQLVERPGLSCFLRDRVFHTCSTYERGLGRARLDHQPVRPDGAGAAGGVGGAQGARVGPRGARGKCAHSIPRRVRGLKRNLYANWN